ncbi:hypothetical protein ACFQ61_10255 [Streptomyces sp. NPDC056500]|uniref:hypothetical protein n=1 Tax=Streptomyces sp. NPDC056500 TaxID=3345840 RepID=UPI00367BA3A0
MNPQPTQTDPPPLRPAQAQLVDQFLVAITHWQEITQLTGFRSEAIRQHLAAHLGAVFPALSKGPECARCGCTENDACLGPCSWVPNSLMVNLCSGCIRPDGTCTTDGCGIYVADLDVSDPTVWGWVIGGSVIGADTQPSWYCTDWCAHHANRVVGEELSAAERASVAEGARARAALGDHHTATTTTVTPADEEKDTPAGAEFTPQGQATVELSDGTVTLTDWSLNDLPPDFYGRVFRELGGWPTAWVPGTISLGTNHMVRATLPGATTYAHDVNVQLMTVRNDDGRTFLSVQWLHEAPVADVRVGGGRR